MTMTIANADDLADESVDLEIDRCLSVAAPNSFFLFAGAGSGKTGSLVRALKILRETRGARLRLKGQRVAIITYTNNARDEIDDRLGFDSLFEVSTIHSFAWSLIQGFHSDIREWLRANLISEITKLESQQAGGRIGQASRDRAKAIDSKSRRLASLDKITNFIYSPDSDGGTRDSLNHSEVIKIVSTFLAKPALRDVLVNRFPVLLIDESQDTNKTLIEALISVQIDRGGGFVLGLFGDMMQRIYNDGKSDLDTTLPDNWATPRKIMNHRCSARITDLLNKIRDPVDKQVQRSRADKAGGLVRLFLLANSVLDKGVVEHRALLRMAELTGDYGWTDGIDSVKTLILEHRMAARRLGFFPMFDALSKSEKLKSGLAKGDLPGLSFLSRVVLPIATSIDQGNEFELMALLRRDSPLLNVGTLRDPAVDPLKQIESARVAVEGLRDILRSGPTTTFSDILRLLQVSGLLEIPEVLITSRMSDETPSPEENSTGIDDANAAWREALDTPFAQLKSYEKYINGRAKFDTHHGVKGRQFPRVCVVMDDADANGTVFSYEKLFGAKAGAKATDATRRLFYVACSRAEADLALIAYTADVAAVREFVITADWFRESEIEIIS